MRTSVTHQLQADVWRQPEQVWHLFDQPRLLATCIESVVDVSRLADGRWRWVLAPISVRHISVVPAATIWLDDRARPSVLRIVGEPTEPDDCLELQAEVNVSDGQQGSVVDASAVVHVDLPLPRMLRPVVRRVGSQYVRRFADDLVGALQTDV